MNDLCVQHTDAGELSIRGIDGLVAACLFRVPEILQQREHPGVRERLFPDPLAGDSEFNAGWHEQLDSELHYLFVSAEETLVRDMAGLDGSTLVVPGEHREAWISALNQARLVLGQQHRMEASDMEREDLEPGDPRDLALLQVHVYGHLVHMLVEA